MMCDILVGIKRGNTYQIIQSGYKMLKKKKKKRDHQSHSEKTKKEGNKVIAITYHKTSNRATEPNK